MEKPTMQQRFQGFVTFLWDSENGKVLGRGGRSWAEIGLFYVVYYVCLASFFAATLAVFYETIDSDKPKLLSSSSLLDGNPGLGFRPMPDINDPKITSKSIQGKNKDYLDNTKDFLKKYQESLKTIDCTGINALRKSEDIPCKVDVTTLTTSCNEANEFGMLDKAPCVLIKLNKVYGWEPKLWDDVNDASIPKDLKADYSPYVVPVKCYTKDKSDNDDLGTVMYYPQQGFPIHYYPYEKQKDYRAPVIFAQFANATQGTTFEIECRAYAKNIHFDRAESQGSTKFKLYVSKN